MASAFGYGLIGSLLTIAAIAGIKAAERDPTPILPPKQVAYISKPLVEVPNQDNVTPTLLIDPEEGYEYIETGSGSITVRYANGVPLRLSPDKVKELLTPSEGK